MRLFVTGASGFIGGALVRRLGLDGHEIKALVRSPRAAALAAKAGAIPVRGDLTRPGPWQDEVGAADAVVHSGALVTDWSPRVEFFRVNVEGTRNVLAAAKGWPGHFVHISSIAVHGFRPGVYTEASPVSPGRLPYCVSKAAAEALVDAAVERGLKASIVRISGAYGPGDTHFAARLIRYASSGRVFVVGRGDQPSKLIYIDDVVEALVAILEHPCEPGARYLLNDPAVPAVLETMAMALEVLGLEVPVRKVPEWLAATAALCAEGFARLSRSTPDLTRYAVRALGRWCLFSPEGTSRKLSWSPRVPARAGLEKTVAWYRESQRSVPPPDPGA
jgi:nucleoside-diphosphate-sugar epimerase